MLGKWILSLGAAVIFSSKVQGMEDKPDFHLQYEGQDIGSIEWHSGSQRATS
jgi:hypothetical protein